LLLVERQWAFLAATVALDEAREAATGPAVYATCVATGYELNLKRTHQSSAVLAGFRTLHHYNLIELPHGPGLKRAIPTSEARALLERERPELLAKLREAVHRMLAETIARTPPGNTNEAARVPGAVSM
jgi:hypothetical protein